MNLLIVDDEKETRNGLEKHIDWAGLGISEVRTAENGNEAIRLCARFLPDILLSDIRMPGLDGIALSNYVRERMPDCQIILLSAYTDKEYLKAAIDLEVVSYVEKPINVKEIENTVKKALARRAKEENRYRSVEKAELPQNTRMRKQKAVLTLIREGMGDGVEKELRELRLFQRPEAWFRVFLFQYPVPALRSNYEDRLSEMFIPVFEKQETAFAFSDSSHTVVVVCDSRKQNLENGSSVLQKLQEQMEEWSSREQPLYCAAGETVQGAASIRQSYQSAVPALQKLFFDGYGHMNTDSSQRNWTLKFDEHLLDEFASCVDRKDREGAAAVLNQARRIIARQSTALPASVKNLYFKFGSLLEWNGMEEGEKGLEAGETDHYLWEGLAQIETLEELHRFFQQQIEKTLSVTEGNAAIAKAVAMIEQHYEDENLSAKSLATSVYLTPAYFSSLFKKETGRTVRQYITGVRMEQAKKMLTDTRYKLYHVSLAVGYTDASYFARTFKKAVGMMPSEYRERHMQ